MLIKNVDIFGVCQDVRLRGGQIAEIAASIYGTADIDGQSCALIPGLHDHHIHINASAAAMNSVRCGPPEISNENDLIAALQRGKGTGWLRGVGYHESVAGEIDRAWLDKHGPDCPVRIQHRSGRMWILNSAAMKALSLSSPEDGRLLDMDATIRKRQDFPDLKPLIKTLLSFGITGVTEVTPSNGMAEKDHYLTALAPLRASIMGKAELPDGHLKLHYHDHDLPSLDDLRLEIIAAHKKGRNIAAHCVTRAELMLTLAALEEAGALEGDRIEHAAIAGEPEMEWMRALHLIVVTQPNFIAERAAAYAKDVPSEEHCNLWRLKSFIDAGLRVAAGSDSPFGDPNPWKAMQAAVSRSPGFIFGEAVSPETALALYTKPFDDAAGKPRRIEIGAAADLCLLDRSWDAARQNLGEVKVLATWIEGQLVFDSVNKPPI